MRNSASAAKVFRSSKVRLSLGVDDFDKISQCSKTFGAPRTAYKNVVSASGFNHIPFKGSEPGPSTYKPSTKTGRPEYTMRPKTCKHLFAVTINPGPGTYDNLQQMSKHAQYTATKHENPSTKVIHEECWNGPKKGDRIPTLAVQKPGPTAYTFTGTSNIYQRMSTTLARKG